MDIGNLPNYEYYSGFEGEPEVILSICGKEELSIHVWVGYFEDIFENASLDGNGWNGFTRDIQQCESTFAGEEASVCIDVDEYLADIQRYRNCIFEFQETAGCLELICSFLAAAQQQHHPVQVSVS